MTATASPSENEITPQDSTSVTSTIVSRKGCFIATAAYGSYLEPDVQTLRTFRDEVLLQFSLGKWLVKQYYANSPAIAELIEDSNTLKQLTRALLMPLVLGVKHPILLLSLILLFGFLFLATKKQHLIRTA